MSEIFKQISDFLIQNEELSINDIIVNYNTSIILREDKSYKICDKYEKNDKYDTILDKECYMGDLTINNINYRLLCDLTLEDDEVEFN